MTEHEAVARSMWEHIRRGEGPTTQRLAAVSAGEAAVLGSQQAGLLQDRLHADVLGLGPLQDLLTDPRVTDILVNGPDAVWVDRGSGLERVAVGWDNPSDVRRLAVRLAHQAGRRLDDATPCVDGLLPDGVRLHAILPPLVDGSAHLSLRVPARRGFSLAEMAAAESLGPGALELLRALIAARVAFVISGGTGSGKTTLLGAMLGEAAADQRLLIVEDVRELRVDHPHVVRLEGRTANVEGAGEIGLPTLVRQALRMRPDRIVVGEVRGAEVRELLAAMNTGHEGGSGTVHANAPADVVARFEALGALAGLAPEATRTQLVSAIRVVLHVHRQHGQRRLAEIGVLSGTGGQARVESAVRWVDGGRSVGPAWSALVELAGMAGGAP